MSEPVLSWWLLVPFVVAAMLYASVGHGGASAYLAILALAGFARPDVTPVVLVLNMLVATTGFLNYYRAGHLSVPLLLPFAVTSIPASFLGGLLTLPPQAYSGVLGVILLAAAFRFLFVTAVVPPRPAGSRAVPWAVGLLVGCGLGFLAGLIGIGGGIFLSPVLLLTGWADAKQTAAVSAAFIVLNSAAGLAGRFLHGVGDLSLLMPMVLSVWAGGLLGSWWGARRIPLVRLQQLLGVVLLVAAAKLLWETVAG